MEIQEVIQLGKYGIVGVMLALVGLCAFVMWLYYKLSSKHISQSNTIFTNVSETLARQGAVLGQLENTVSKLETTIQKLEDRINEKL